MTKLLSFLFSAGGGSLPSSACIFFSFFFLNVWQIKHFLIFLHLTGQQSISYALHICKRELLMEELQKIFIIGHILFHVSCIHHVSSLGAGIDD